ncbi:hypothetical protein Hanom_Chr06g00533061 [Helianthus anomalus]
MKFKRMRVELVASNYGSARSITRWPKLNIKETYKKLEDLRAKDLTVLQKLVYPTTIVGRPQQTQTSKNLLSTSALPANPLNQLKRKKQSDEEDEQRFEEYKKRQSTVKLNSTRIMLLINLLLN